MTDTRHEENFLVVFAVEEYARRHGISAYDTLGLFLNNEYLEIRNPGQFRQEQIFIAEKPIKIRRIIPIPKARNPNLADILKYTSDGKVEE